LRLGHHNLPLEIGEHGFFEPDFRRPLNETHLVDFILQLQ